MTKYWCYLCQKQFQASSAPNSCAICKQDAFQEMTPDSHPQLFEAYQPTANSNNNFPQNFQGFTQMSYSNQANQQVLRISTQQLFQPIINFSNVLLNGLSRNEGNNNQGRAHTQEPINSLNHSFGAVLNNLPHIFNFCSQIYNNYFQLLVNSGQNYRRATQQQINSLEKIDNPKDCAICQGENEEKGFKLKCNHQFHENCLIPWFQRANTCPTCRNPI